MNHAHGRYMKRWFTTTVASATAIVLVLAARGWPPNSVIDAFTVLLLALGIAILAALVAENIPAAKGGGGGTTSNSSAPSSDSSLQKALPDPLDHGLEPPLI